MNTLLGLVLGVFLAGSVLVNVPDLKNISKKLYTTVMNRASPEAVLTEHKPLNKTVENKSYKSIVALPEQEAASAQPYTDHPKLRKEVEELKEKLAVIQLKEKKRLVLEQIQTLLTKLKKGNNHV